LRQPLVLDENSFVLFSGAWLACEEGHKNWKEEDVMKNMLQTARVSPSMIRSVFSQLKANGYTDEQILALSAGLADLIEPPADGLTDDLASEENVQGGASDGLGEEDGLADLGYSEEYESLCAAGLPPRD
jgi:hypothetical protein